MSTPSRIARFISNKAKLKYLRQQSPIFGELQYRSAIGIECLLESGCFRNPDPIITTFNGLMERVAAGISGQGTPNWRKMQHWMLKMPHETTLLGGPFIHIPEDIGGGLDDALRHEGVLPLGYDYREMYSAVRASLRSTAHDLLAEVGPNTMSTAINLNEGVIKATGCDPSQWLRDLQLSRRGGELEPGLPLESNIEAAFNAIRSNPDTAIPIFDINRHK